MKRMVSAKHVVREGKYDSVTGLHQGWMVMADGDGDGLDASGSSEVDGCWMVGPKFFPQTGLPVWGSYSFQRVATLGRMILPLSPGLHPTLGALGRMSLHLSSTCLSQLSSTLGALGRMSLQFTLVSHTRLPDLSFTLVSHTGCLGPHEFTLVFPFVSHTCLPIWLPWAA